MPAPSGGYRMHGIIFSELQKYCNEKLDPSAWKAVLTSAGLPNRAYLATRAYDDAEVLAIVGTASTITGIAIPALLEDFGAYIVPDLVKVYGGFIRKEWKTLELIENTEEAIH